MFAGKFVVGREFSMETSKWATAERWGVRTDQKVRGEEDCGRGIRLGSWRRSLGSSGGC